MSSRSRYAKRRAAERFVTSEQIEVFRHSFGICTECGMPDRVGIDRWPHRTDHAHDPRRRAFYSECENGIPYGSPHL